MTPIDFDEKGQKNFSPLELARGLMQMPVRKRLEAILQRADAEAVVAAMPAQDFYFSIQEIGPDDSLPLLALAQQEQINYLFDLEWWRKDSLRPANALRWLERLAVASEEKLLHWLYQVDFELLVAIFKQWIQADITPDDVDPLEARDQLPKNTIDDAYYWEAKYPQYEDFIKNILSLLFEVNQGFYRELMHHVIHEITLEVEEEAYRFHRARLEDMAIPDYYDALEIYRSLRPEEILPRKHTVPPKPDDIPSPSFALAMVPRGDLLGRALSEIKDYQTIDAIQLELAALANKVVVADQAPTDSADALHHAVDKTVAGVNLGLDLLCRDSLKCAVESLREVFLEELFRLGHAQVFKLRNRLQIVEKRGWPSRWPTGLNCLESEWLDHVELLLAKTPKILRPASQGGASPQEDFFRTQQDLFREKHFIDVIISLEKLFDALNVHPERLSPQLWVQAQVRNLKDVTLGVMIRTGAAQFLSRGKWEVEPLSVKNWSAIFPLVQPDSIEATIRSWADATSPDPALRSLAESYLATLFSAYADEMKPFSPDNPPDPRFVKFFLFTEE